MSLSLCMIVKNEENYLRTCLESIKDIVDEMIIVDTGSTDNTANIAIEYGAHVYSFEWTNHFSDARNFSIEKATMDWILVMDADDELEKDDKQKLLDLTRETPENKKTNIYFCKTLSYVGEKNSSDIFANMNPRLIRNHKGYKFHGAIHEQMLPLPEDANNIDVIKYYNIRFHHYGYLKKLIEEKDKRERNMSIIQKCIEENPSDGFMLFNMGTEYFAMSNFSKALEYYKQSFALFNPNISYNSILILKIVHCLNYLGQYEDALNFIDTGLKYYPSFTDFEFVRAIIHYNEGNLTLSISSLLKCIDMGEPPENMHDLVGVGSFRAYDFLSSIYFELNNYNASYQYAKKALEVKPDFMESFNRLSKLLFIIKKPVVEIKSELESYHLPHDENYYLRLVDIFYNQKMYEISYEYVIRAEEFSNNSQKTLFYKGICLFYLKKLPEAYNELKKINSEEFYEKALNYSILSQILDNKMRIASKLLNKASEFMDTYKNKVYVTFKDLMHKKNCAPLSVLKEDSQNYLPHIFDLLSILLQGYYFDEFEKALQLLNLVENDEVLLLLGKLYYKHGFFKLAYNEFIRSIKLYEKTDLEGIDMMKSALINIQSTSDSPK